MTSGQLMEAVRKLEYKGKYKVCEAFFNMMMEEGFGDDSKDISINTNETNYPGLMVQMERRAPSKHLFDAFQRARREFESPLAHNKKEWKV